MHTPDGEAFDWMDGVIFFRVSCAVEMEGLANLNAEVTSRRVSAVGAIEHEAGDGARGENLNGREARVLEA